MFSVIKWYINHRCYTYIFKLYYMLGIHMSIYTADCIDKKQLPCSESNTKYFEYKVPLLEPETIKFQLCHKCVVTTVGSVVQHIDDRVETLEVPALMYISLVYHHDACQMHCQLILETPVAYSEIIICRSSTYSLFGGTPPMPWQIVYLFMRHQLHAGNWHTW